MKINIAFNFNIDMPDCKIDTIIAALKKVLPLFLTEFVKTILLEFANHYMKEVEKPFSGMALEKPFFGNTLAEGVRLI